MRQDYHSPGPNHSWLDLQQLTARLRTNKISSAFFSTFYMDPVCVSENYGSISLLLWFEDSPLSAAAQTCIMLSLGHISL